MFWVYTRCFGKMFIILPLLLGLILLLCVSDIPATSDSHQSVLYGSEAGLVIHLEVVLWPGQIAP